MELKKYKQKNKKRVGIILFTGLCIGLIAGVFFFSSYASFQTNDTIPFMNGDVEDPGDIYFAYYVDDKITWDLPGRNSGYTLDTSASTCTNGVIPSWDNASWKFVGDYSGYTNENSRTRCNLYFVKEKTVDTVLGTLTVNSYTPDFSKSACDSETCGTHEKGIFAIADSDGTSYYYRGSVDNNYFQFANLWWRVVRVNGDGTVRLIYDGTTPHTNGESSTDRQYGTSQFNTTNNDNMYVGYMYTSGQANGLGTSSTIKQANDAFYDAKLASYASYIDTNAGFCGDRSTLNLQSGVGTGKVTTYNKGYLRVVESDPSLACENASDLYTLASSTKGNKALTKPVGLLTADEALLAGVGGGVFDGNYNHQPVNPNGYLTTGNTFWTMTPAGGYNPFGVAFWSSVVFSVGTSGRFDDINTSSAPGLRPVINIRSDVTISGNGTIDNPYQVI